MEGRHVIVRVPNWLGDIVMALPALASIRAASRGARLTVAGPRAFIDLLRLVPGVDAVVGLAGGSGLAMVRGSHPDIATIAGLGADIGILLTNSFGSALLLRRARVPERWGFATDGRRWLLTRAISRRSGVAAGQTCDPRHHAGYYLRLARALGFAPEPDEPPRLLVPAHVREAGASVLSKHGWRPGEPVVGFAPGAAYGGAKRWAPTAVADTMRRLAAELPTPPGSRFVLIGASGDRRSGVDVEEALRATGHEALARPPALVNLIGQTSLVEMVGAMAACDVFVSNDSGAMHVASALGVPVVAIFGPTREVETHPLGLHTLLTADVFCRPCMLRECPIDHRCMTRIAPERVVAATRAFLDARSRKP